jgi:hypothetical protein
MKAVVSGRGASFATSLVFFFYQVQTVLRVYWVSSISIENDTWVSLVVRVNNVDLDVDV